MYYFTLKFRLSIWTGIGWSVCTEIDGQLRLESGGQFDRFFQLLFQTPPIVVVDNWIVLFTSTEEFPIIELTTGNKFTTIVIVAVVAQTPIVGVNV